MTGCASADPFVTAALIAPYLGVEVDSLTDAQVALIERSGKTALALIESYVGYPLRRETFTQTDNSSRSASVVLLGRMPVDIIYRVQVDGVTLARDRYVLDGALGVLKFDCCLSFRTMVISGDAGYSSVPDMPAELSEALASISVGIYNRNGSLAMPAASDTALKSLTMFDAMSMSFDQAGSIEALSPEKLVSQWAFVLNKYRLVL